MPQTSSDLTQIICPVDDCSAMLNSVVQFEKHYRALHSFQCGQCGSKFSTSRALDVHAEEDHSQFFAAKLDLYPNGDHFECFATPQCALKFVSKELRDDHCRRIHYLENKGRIKEESLKQLSDVERSVRRIEISSPNELQFGADQERMFEQKRKKLTAKRVLK